jgi:hypothetical protein
MKAHVRHRSAGLDELQRFAEGINKRDTLAQLQDGQEFVNDGG